LPRDRWRSVERSPPPAATSALRSRSSASSPSMCAARAANASEEQSTLLVNTVIGQATFMVAAIERTSGSRCMRELLVLGAQARVRVGADRDRRRTALGRQNRERRETAAGRSAADRARHRSARQKVRPARFRPLAHRANTPQWASLPISLPGSETSKRRFACSAGDRFTAR